MKFFPFLNFNNIAKLYVKKKRRKNLNLYKLPSRVFRLWTGRRRRRPWRCLWVWASRRSSRGRRGERRVGAVGPAVVVVAAVVGGVDWIGRLRPMSEKRVSWMCFRISFFWMLVAGCWVLCSRLSRLSLLIGGGLVVWCRIGSGWGGARARTTWMRMIRFGSFRFGFVYLLFFVCALLMELV